MKAWLCENPIGVEALRWTDMPTPSPSPDEVLVEIKAASLNFPDILIVQNKYQMKPSLPFVPGSEYAGVIQAIGANVKHLAVGQSVACLSGTGGFGTHTLAPAKLCVPLPPQFPMVDAAAFIMIYATSYHALIDRAQLKAGETVLVLGAAGGVGSAAIQIAKAVGARVIAASSTQDKYLVIGFAAGPIPSLPLNLALLKGASIVGVFWGDFAKREPEANAQMMGTLLDWYSSKKIKPHIDSTVNMEDLPAAYLRMGSREVMGKLVLVN